jgi:hypothetical protein
MKTGYSVSESIWIVLRRSEKHSAFSSGPGEGTKRIKVAVGKEAVIFNYRNAVLIPQGILDKKLLFDAGGFPAAGGRFSGVCGLPITGIRPDYAAPSTILPCIIAIIWLIDHCISAILGKDSIMERAVLCELADWKTSPDRKLLLLRGARQVGKSWAGGIYRIQQPHLFTATLSHGLGTAMCAEIIEESGLYRYKRFSRL